MQIGKVIGRPRVTIGDLNVCSYHVVYETQKSFFRFLGTRSLKTNTFRHLERIRSVVGTIIWIFVPRRRVTITRFLRFPNTSSNRTTWFLALNLKWTTHDFFKYRIFGRPVWRTKVLIDPKPFSLQTSNGLRRNRKAAQFPEHAPVPPRMAYYRVWLLLNRSSRIFIIEIILKKP